MIDWCVLGHGLGTRLYRTNSGWPVTIEEKSIHVRQRYRKATLPTFWNQASQLAYAAAVERERMRKEETVEVSNE